ncbi:alpha-N-arabinofuranosidase [Pedobacter frigidisoli]|uniref:non-reducing end alpha-L-arabinofuranosidase n=1 Tax=Pedobacter frigidisoli TaxID=2530455 RepID=A0A4R0NW35_9SPHI|nr:alpha-L-arabinofuranosidase C-terminal domain-containing protein [Pedobacter frigidisoli]TCD05902.1 alpha-N-arabinofuranosidase [Pedobacter frigidisoli]
MLSRRNFITLAGRGGLSFAFANKTVAGVIQSFDTALLEATITIDFTNPEGTIDRAIYGQFIEHLGRAINGGIFEEGSPLSNKKGVRLDVLDKIKQLHPTVMRYPGGTFTKIYHWMDGIGPLNERRARPNLIWGGLDTNRFGTDEAITYSRTIGADPYFSVNMGTGTAEEAGNWVEYCNGIQDTYYANLRRKNGHMAPHKVKYWGLGNEEAAGPDIGRLQKVEDYVKEAWFYTKAMKLQDKSIKLILCGADDKAWNDHVLKEMGDVCDYISLHCYVGADKAKPASLFPHVEKLEKSILEIKQSIQANTVVKVTDFKKWYRFPPRPNPVKIAIDELGIWETGTGAYDLEDLYNWNHALGTATFFNIMQRQASVVGMATWAQTVNVLAPIMTSKSASVCQTIYYPMQFYREHAGNISLKCDVKTSDMQIPGSEGAKTLDVSATLNEADGTFTLFVVNRHPESAVKTRLGNIDSKKYNTVKAYELNAASILAINTLEQPHKNVVVKNEKRLSGIVSEYIFPAHSITALVYGKV